MEVKVLGTGCKRCQTTYDLIDKISKEEGISIQLEKIEDVQELMKYNIISTPAVVVNNVVKISGKVPNREEILRILKN